MSALKQGLIASPGTKALFQILIWYLVNSVTSARDSQITCCTAMLTAIWQPVRAPSPIDMHEVSLLMYLLLDDDRYIHVLKG